MLWHEEKTQNVMRNYYFFANRDFVAVYLCFLMLFVHLIVMLLDLSKEFTSAYYWLEETF